MDGHDFLNFDKLIAPTLIKLVYWVGLIFILLSTLGSLFMGFGFGGGIIHFFVTLLGAMLSALVWRIICELWTAIFSINDRLGIIAGQKQ
jgi:hypothetical protein